MTEGHLQDQSSLIQMFAVLIFVLMSCPRKKWNLHHTIFQLYGIPISRSRCIHDAIPVLTCCRSLSSFSRGIRSSITFWYAKRLPALAWLKESDATHHTQGCVFTT